MNSKIVALFVVATSVGFVQQVSAADIPVPEYRAPAQVVVPPFNWTGGYAGLNVGYGFGKISNISGTASDSMSGVIGGGQVGIQMQTGMFVFGAEADFQGSWQQRSVTVTAGGITGTAKEEIPWFGTLRGRAGVAFDRSLLYVTGGGAYTNFKLSATALGVTVSSNSSHGAWTVGGGWEYAFADHWSAKVEYLYIDTGNVNTVLFTIPVSGRLTDNIVRIGANYRF